jgi:hypothetical protein
MALVSRQARVLRWEARAKSVMQEALGKNPGRRAAAQAFDFKEIIAKTLHRETGRQGWVFRPGAGRRGDRVTIQPVSGRCSVCSLGSASGVRYRTHTARGVVFC